MNKYLLCVGAAVLLAAAGAVAAPSVETFTKAPDRPVDLAHDRNLYVVGYAHLDTQWRWTYPQVTGEFLANTLHDNFALFKKYPDYIFNFSGSRRYEMMAEYYPAEFEELKHYVAAGRWFPAGSSVDEGDSNVPSAESLIRQVLYGNYYFRRTFGIASEEFMLPDCFGFPASLPTILAHCGIKGFSTQKLTWGSAVGIPFKVGVWVGPDGRSVVAALDPGSYAAGVTEDLSRSEPWLKRIEATGEKSGAYVDYHYYGTGDRGGAPKDESVRWIERSIAGHGPIRVISARSDQMFKDLQPEQIAKLPRYQGELLLTQHSAGSISSEAYMKRWNRKNELLADAAERASVAAAWLGAAPYPSGKLYSAWDLVLGSQMHDMLPGTSLPKAYEYCWNDELLAANQFSAALTEATGGVAAGMDTTTKGVALVVYNPLSIARSDVVEANVEFPGGAPASATVIGPNGHAHAVQVLSHSGTHLRVAFVASVGPVSFSVFEVRPGDPGAAESRNPSLRASTSGLENGRYRVSIAPDGNVTSIFDKQAGRELLAGPSRFAFMYEKPKMYPAWNMDWADQEKAPRAWVEGPAHIRVVEDGPVRVAVEIEREAQGSRFVQTVRLAAGAAGDRVEFANRIDWQTRESVLKAVFPLTLSNPLTTYDTQVGTVERGINNPKKYEVPQHEWFDQDATDNSFGVAVLNDCKYGSDKPDDQTLRLTLLYTPGVRNRYQDQATQDFGRHDILYAVTSHAGDWRQGNVPWAAARLNEPLLAFQVAAHPGALGRSLSVFTVSSPQVSLEAVKKAEDSNEVIVRFQELTGHPAKDVTLSAAGGIAAAREVDGQERSLGAAHVDRGALRFDLPAYGLRAFALTLRAPAAPVAAPNSAPVRLAYNEDVVSTNANRTDGSFDRQHQCYPAEQLPAHIVSEGVEFVMGPTADGQPNAVAARGQAIALPAGHFDRICLLAAADGDTKGRFLVDGRPVDLTIQNWTGYIGQWDNRLWAGEVPELSYSWFNSLAGLAPGYVKPGEVAWYASHRHGPDGDEHYQYSYLFEYTIAVPGGAKTLTLPDDGRIRVFAVSVARDTHERVRAATPLFDRLEDHQPDAPRLSPQGGTFDDSTRVVIQPPLYWREGGLHYTLDGSTPTLASPTCTGPVTVDHDAVVTACEFDAQGRAGPVVRETYTVHDRTPPRVLSAVTIGETNQIRLVFSERITAASARARANYVLDGAAQIEDAQYDSQADAVVLTLSEPLAAATSLRVQHIRDGSTAGNELSSQTVPVAIEQPVYHYASVTPGQSVAVDAPGLPVAKGQSWTMNVYVRTTAAPDNRTLIAGFGRLDDKRNGTARYFGKFANGIHVWVRGPNELESTTPLRADGWQMLTATYDGTMLRLFVDGHPASSIETALAKDASVVRLAPIDPWDHERRFQGDIRAFAIWDHVLSPEAMALLALKRPRD
ncbi:MAG TPA: glycoside hydrolase family 38 C-terminal domain-containing protein [Opitutaceae bacterium]|nr:glycoside hydrolase family 38 C-terminal domain-containing protein [Opitutaceae bacterium]